MIFFNVVSADHFYYPPRSAQDIAFLVPDNWDDFGQFATWFDLWYVDENSNDHKIGGTKIGQYGMGQGHRAGETDSTSLIRSPTLPNHFSALSPDQFFSVGQDNSFYENLKKLPAVTRVSILQGLCDFAYDLSLLERALSETVTTRSLLRSVTKETVRGQYARLAQGRHIDFSYGFTFREQLSSSVFNLNFDVRPGTRPPTNMHVLIGENGVGKTTVLQRMTAALTDGITSAANGYRFTFEAIDDDNLIEFSQLVSVAFSAFDPFVPPPNPAEYGETRYDYIGLKKLDRGGNYSTKTSEDLARDFYESLMICARGQRLERWRRITNILQENFFASTRVRELFIWEENFGVSDVDLESHTIKIFDEMSSGHKIVLLTLTRLVELVAESTIVLIDEPESHLHPPFLSSFLRAITELVNERNGVAIVATHSPVVLQEVPRSCVWRLVRFGDHKTAFRPNFETFAENVGILTNDIFSLESVESGYKKLIKDSINQSSTYESVQKTFNYQIGAEGRAFIRTILPRKSEPSTNDQ